MKRGEGLLDATVYNKIERMERLMEKLIYLLGNNHSSIQLLDQRIRHLESIQPFSQSMVLLSRNKEGKSETAFQK